MRVWRGAVALLVLLGTGLQARADSVDDYVKAEMVTQQIPGVSLAVLRDGKPIKVAGYGVADLDRKTPVTPDTIYDVGPVGTPFTAATVLMLMEAGKLRPTDPLSRFFANDPPQWRAITVWHLLTNTSGIRDYLTETPTTAALDFTPDLIYNRAIGARPNFAPGTQFRASRTNYVLLGLIVEASTGRPFSDYVANRIFKPLGMAETLVAGEGLPSHLATGYLLANGGRIVADRDKHAFGDAFFSSNVNDLSKWAAALDTGAILSEPALTAMWTPAPLVEPSGKPSPPGAKPKAAPYGVGWYIDTIHGHRLIWQGGSAGGYSSALARFPDDRLTVIVLANLGDANALALARGVASRYSAALK